LKKLQNNNLLIDSGWGITGGYMDRYPQKKDCEPSGDILAGGSLLMYIEDFERQFNGENLPSGEYFSRAVVDDYFKFPKAIEHLDIVVEQRVKEDDAYCILTAEMTLKNRGRKLDSYRIELFHNFIMSLRNSSEYRYFTDIDLSDTFGVIIDHNENIACLLDTQAEENGQQFTVSMVPLNDPEYSNELISACLSHSHIEDFLTLTRKYFEAVSNCPNQLKGMLYLYDHFDEACDPRRNSHSSSIISFEDLAGLESEKKLLQEIALTFLHPEIVKKWECERPQGILLYGPPGTGKTTLAKAFSNEIHATLIQKSCTDIMSMWVGESAKNIRKMFEEAKKSKGPTVLFLDEFDGLVAGTGNRQSQNSLLAALKEELSSLKESHPHILVIAATNNEDQLDENLMRAGRFDIKVYIPKPDDIARAQIFEKMIPMQENEQTFSPFQNNIDFVKLAETKDDITGADIKEVLRRLRLRHAMQEIRERRISPITEQDIIDELSKYHH
jgi:SpoVK/Ycf46/Vps4 family AAA+-type ATPase